MPLGNPIQKNNDTRIVSATATTGQTEFTVTGGYSINNIGVFRNGVRLSNSDDFTASDGSTVNLNVAADVGDNLDFHVWDKFTVSNAIVGAASTQTVSGNLRVTGELYSDDFRPDHINTTTTDGIPDGSTRAVAGNVGTVGTNTKPNRLRVLIARGINGGEDVGDSTANSYSEIRSLYLPATTDTIMQSVSVGNPIAYGEIFEAITVNNRISY